MKAGEQNHNYMRNKKNSSRIMAEEKEISLMIQSKRKIENEKKYGKSKNANFIKIGELDRLSGNPPQKLSDEEIQISYGYGYFEKGSRVLEGIFANKTFDKEKQRSFGMQDFIHNVPEKYINNLKKYPAYLEGRIFQMGKYAYDQCLEKNISFEECFLTMIILYPEIKTPIFKLGYETREEEIKNKKRTQ